MAGGFGISPEEHPTNAPNAANNYARSLAKECVDCGPMHARTNEPRTTPHWATARGDAQRSQCRPESRNVKARVLTRIGRLIGNRRGMLLARSDRGLLGRAGQLCVGPNHTRSWRYDGSTTPRQWAPLEGNGHPWARAPTGSKRLPTVVVRVACCVAGEPYLLDPAIEGLVEILLEHAYHLLVALR